MSTYCHIDLWVDLEKNSEKGGKMARLKGERK